MIDYHSTLVTTLNTILPTHYEMNLSSGTSTPCISYMELANNSLYEGDTLRYSILQYQVKVWGTDIGVLQGYAQQIDTALKPLGFKRIGCHEFYDYNSAMIQKIMTYEATASETINN